MRCPLPTSEGDVLAYICYLSLGWKLSPESLLQYVSAVSRYHEIHSLNSPTRNTLVSALIRAYTRRFDETATQVLLRVGLPASVVYQIVDAGLAATQPQGTVCCTEVLLAFIFQVFSVSMAHVKRADIKVGNDFVTVSFCQKKGKSF